MAHLSEPLRFLHCHSVEAQVIPAESLLYSDEALAGLHKYSEAVQHSEVFEPEQYSGIRPLLCSVLAVAHLPAADSVYRQAHSEQGLREPQLQEPPDSAVRKVALRTESVFVNYHSEPVLPRESAVLLHRYPSGLCQAEHFHQ